MHWNILLPVMKKIFFVLIVMNLFSVVFVALWSTLGSIRWKRYSDEEKLRELEEEHDRVLMANRIVLIRGMTDRAS